MKFLRALFSKQRIYLDYAGATPLCAEAKEEMRRALRFFGNPGALHREGVEASAELERSRERIARTLGCKPRELIFTSGGTEANNLAIMGLAKKLQLTRRSLEGTHWIVSAIEHPSVLAAFGEVERMGGEVVWVSPSERGIVTPEAVRAALRRETVCVSIGWANSEIGVIQPLARIARTLSEHERAHKTEVYFHSDAGQAPLYLQTTVHTLGVDLLTLDSGKLYGPHGVGALYVSDRVPLAPILAGGSQERGLRPGTENVALAAGYAAAFEHAARYRDVEARRIRVLRDELLARLKVLIPPLVVNGDLSHALPHMLNISIPHIQSEYTVLALDHAGIALSTKSACREGEERRSHVVEALGGDAWRSETTLRFSLGAETTSTDIRRVAGELERAVHMQGALLRKRE